MRLGSVAAALVLAAVLAGGCGEREFTAEEFVEAANEQGAALVLGDTVTTNEDGDEVLAVRLGRDRGAEPNTQLFAGGGTGTMLVVDDAGRAGDEFGRCEAAADLTCFRAANVVLRFEAMDPADRARVSGAVSALASE